MWNSYTPYTSTVEQLYTIYFYSGTVIHHILLQCTTCYQLVRPFAKCKGLGKYKYHISLKGIQLDSVYVSIRNHPFIPFLFLVTLHLSGTKSHLTFCLYLRRAVKNYM